MDTGKGTSAGGQEDINTKLQGCGPRELSRNIAHLASVVSAIEMATEEAQAKVMQAADSLLAAKSNLQTAIRLEAKRKVFDEARIN